MTLPKTENTNLQVPFKYHLTCIAMGCMGPQIKHPQDGFLKKVINTGTLIEIFV